MNSPRRSRSIISTQSTGCSSIRSAATTRSTRPVLALRGIPLSIDAADQPAGEGVFGDADSRLRQVRRVGQSLHPMPGAVAMIAGMTIKNFWDRWQPTGIAAGDDPLSASTDG